MRGFVESRTKQLIFFYIDSEFKSSQGHHIFSPTDVDLLIFSSSKMLHSVSSSFNSFLSCCLSWVRRFHWDCVRFQSSVLICFLQLDAFANTNHSSKCRVFFYTSPSLIVAMIHLGLCVFLRTTNHWQSWSLGIASATKDHISPPRPMFSWIYLFHWFPPQLEISTVLEIVLYAKEWLVSL